VKGVLSVKLMEWLRLPESRRIKELDDPATTILHGQIIQKKLFLKKLYIDFYEQFKKATPDFETKVLVELGSGGGFVKEVISNVITSDIIELPNVDKVFSAADMPFESKSVDAFFMIDVLHHIADSRVFFAEAMRCLKPGGRIIMIEPANTLWSRFIYRNFHHEEFDTEGRWGLKGTGPLSQGNGAIPWIIFSRDRKIFEEEFPKLRIIRIRRHTPIRYLLSGGLSLRQLVPSFAYPIVKVIELALSPFNDMLGMFQTIELEKIS
jgi:SAM-dependent methyltransferase